MKNKLFITTILLCTFSFAFAEDLEEGFYNPVNGLKDCELKGTLKELIRDHTVIGYGTGSWEMFYYADRDENGYCMDMYCDDWKQFTSPGTAVSGCNVEHSFAKSWWGGATNDAYKDCYHLNPSNSTANSARSNYPLGIVTNLVKTAGSLKIGKQHHDSLNVDFNIWEPKDEYKGDFARAYFYMATCYGKDKYGNYDPTICSAYQGWRLDNKDVGSRFAMQNDNYLEFQRWEQDVLIAWHRQDPVSEKEIKRMEAVSNFQHNRNPFIDYPYLAEYIWGDRAGEEVNMADLMASSDPDFVPGVSDGWRGGGGPVTPKIKYGVTWFVNGEVLSVDSIVENKKIPALPAKPVSCSSECTEFMGWTIHPIDGKTDEAPAMLFTKIGEFPAVTANVAYYAVFAKKTVTDGAEPATYSYSIENPISDWTNTATNKSSYWLLESGTQITSPEVNLAGLTSISATIRTFGSKSFNTLTVSANGETIASITTDKGTTLTTCTWNNDQTLSGRSPITFSSDYGSGKGIGISAITINATGVEVTYSDYITSCSETTSLQYTRPAPTATKFIRDGQIYIQVGQTIYTLMGQAIK